MITIKFVPNDTSRLAMNNKKIIIVSTIILVDFRKELTGFYIHQQSRNLACLDNQNKCFIMKINETKINAKENKLISMEC